MTPLQRRMLQSLINNPTTPEDQKREAEAILRGKPLPSKEKPERLLTATMEEVQYMHKNREACRELTIAYNAIKKDKLDPAARREWNYRLSVFRLSNVLAGSSDLPLSRNLSRPSSKR